MTYLPNTDFHTEIARQIASDPNAALDYKIQHGLNLDIDKGPEDIWDGGGLWTEPTGPDTYDLVSTSGADTQTVTILGLDASGAVAGENVVMNGTTPVTTVGTYAMINDMVITSGGANVGTITAQETVSAQVNAQINPLNGRSRMAIYKVPSNKSAFLVQGYAQMQNDSNKSEATVTVWVKPPGGDYLRTFDFFLRDVGATNWNYQARIPTWVVGESFIKVQATTSKNNTAIAAGFELFFEDA